MSVDRPAYKNFTASDLTILDGTCEYDIAEVKADGIWGEMQVFGRRAVVFSRHGKLKDSWGIPTHFPRLCVLHGEFMYGSAFSKEGGRSGKFYAFDCTTYDSDLIEKCGLMVRRRQMEEVVRRMGCQRVTPVRQYPLSTTSLVDLWEKMVVQGGWEGLVLKRNEAPFGEGFARIKAEFEVDYVCTGFKQSDSEKYKGCMVRSITGGLYTNTGLIDVVSVSGMNEDERMDMYNHPEKYIGKVFRARGKAVFKSGAVRHPNYCGMHKEKMPYECRLADALSVRPGGSK